MNVRKVNTEEDEPTFQGTRNSSEEHKKRPNLHINHQNFATNAKDDYTPLHLLNKSPSMMEDFTQNTDNRFVNLSPLKHYKYAGPLVSSSPSQENLKADAMEQAMFPGLTPEVLLNSLDELALDRDRISKTL